MYDSDHPNTLPEFALPVIFALLILMVALVADGAQPPAAARDAAQPNPSAMNDAERAFSESLANVMLTGRFTTDGKNSNPEPERYGIISATKVRDNNWLILARISYGRRGVRPPAIPIPVKIDWAGDTPVLSLTDLTIPGFGTFTSRVMFYGDRYAGTWQHGEKGGHLFGTIAAATEEPEDETAPQSAPSEPPQP